MFPLKSTNDDPYIGWTQRRGGDHQEDKISETMISAMLLVESTDFDTYIGSIAEWSWYPSASVDNLQYLVQ